MASNLTRALTAAAVTCVLAWPGSSRAALIWFDSSNAAAGYPAFANLAAAYADFQTDADHNLGFDGWQNGTIIDDEYAATEGVQFENVGRSGARGVRREGRSPIRSLTGYDGSLRPNGDNVLLKSNNNDAATPFTIRFAQPVEQVGAFFAMGTSGSIHTLTVRAYDAAGVLLGSQTFDSWLWERSPSNQNYESFFALRSAGEGIARVELLNDARSGSARNLMLDDVRFSLATASVPEPANLFLLAFGLLLTPWPTPRR